MAKCHYPNPNTKNACRNPKHIIQWYFIHWRFVCSIQSGYFSTGFSKAEFKNGLYCVLNCIGREIIQCHIEIIMKNVEFGIELVVWSYWLSWLVASERKPKSHCKMVSIPYSRISYGNRAYFVHPRYFATAHCLHPAQQAGFSFIPIFNLNLHSASWVHHLPFQSSHHGLNYSRPLSPISSSYP